MHIKYSSEIIDKKISINLGVIEFKAKVEAGNNELWTIINEQTYSIKKSIKLDDVINNEIIAATRAGYKKCGKDPARYRPSAESLRRRIIKGNDLYKVNNVVDVLNYISLKTGFSIGGYDKDKIIGEISIGIGNKYEDYNGIGRGKINIDGLPALKDNNGVFGTPTSDSVLSKIDKTTQNILFVFYDFKKSSNLDYILAETQKMLENYCNATNFQVAIINSLY